MQWHVCLGVMTEVGHGTNSHGDGDDDAVVDFDGFYHHANLRF
jgi:hypothetical protein